ncbi:hypothetical protein WQ54_13465 [Bacillus sp. SA1-12]|uniref:CidA/LrgA family protein n=1 Tax=Bacillus sp. SA1-12 TaxID=1455638 RepID=UPI000625D044|nr:CidA/LrgA family holin-like protein [Bacillus sp. SA1-12]KKI91631.1 hypothetical protein WQ54_13465 [Bacillus sp. SA1-12]
MKFVKIAFQILCLYTIYLIGVYIKSVFDLFVPGSIIGMILLFGALHFQLLKHEWFLMGGSLLLKHLPLLFIPATVGIIDYLDIFKGSGVITIGIVLISTCIVMAVSALISDCLVERSQAVNKDKGLHL